jgi:hypothetical protein
LIFETCWFCHKIRYLGSRYQLELKGIPPSPMGFNACWHWYPDHSSQSGLYWNLFKLTSPGWRWEFQHVPLRTRVSLPGQVRYGISAMESFCC